MPAVAQDTDLESRVQSACGRSAPPAVETHALPREMVFIGRDAWQAGLEQHLLAVDCIPADPLHFKGNAVLATLCGNRYGELRVDASRMIRRDPQADRAGAGQVKAMWQLAGRSRVHQGPHGSTLEAGNWTVCDSGRDYAIDFDHSARCIVMLVPRAQCPGWLPGLSALAALALPEGGPAQTARCLLALLLRDAAELDADCQRALRDAVVALVGLGLSAELRRRGLPTQTRHPVDCARVQSYVLEHLDDNGLTIDRIAAVFGMSRRSLYKVFAALGSTPRAFIQSARLERARALLSQGGPNDLPLVRISEQCGYADAAHFSRAFRARYGVAPSAWRGRGG